MSRGKLTMVGCLWEGVNDGAGAWMRERRGVRADRSLDKPCEAAIWDGIALKGLRA